MNTRYAVLCERLRIRTRFEKWLAPYQTVDDESDINEVESHMSEEELLTIEAHLGFRLPEMLRTLYLVNGTGHLDRMTHGRHIFSRKYVAEMKQERNSTADDKHTRRIMRFAPEVVEELRQHPGACIALGEDGIPCYMPEHLVQLVSPVIGATSA